MPTLDDLHTTRWNLIAKNVPYAPDNGIPTFWRQHPELGSPIGREVPLDDGSVAQAFSGGIVAWDSQNGARVVTE